MAAPQNSVREGAPTRWDRLTERDQAFWTAGWTLAGVDEAGRGPLAGPVVAAAVVWRHAPTEVVDLDDSKRLSAAARQRAYQAITAHGAAFVGVGAAGPRTIDRMNIYQATTLAMQRALAALQVKPDWVLTDYVPFRWHCPVEALVHGDQRSASIAAASVVAKVLRDRYMDALDAQYPQYGFARHRGYPTAAHRAALQTWGPCPAHRMTFRGSTGENSRAGPHLV